MKFLLLILSTIISWFVTSKNSVSGDADWPYGVTYVNTYQKGDVRAGDSAIIAFTQMGGMTIEHVDVYLKSNKSSGAGILAVEANGRLIVTKSGSLKDWCGNYDNSEYHAVTLLSEPIKGIDELSIKVVGTTNSLHIEKFTIQYTAAQPRTVTLMCGNKEYKTITETQSGGGVNLPVPPDVPSWDGFAWSETEFWEMKELPPTQIVYPGTKYYPKEDCVLWAVYQQDNTPSTSYATDLCTGEYLYVNCKTHMAMSDVPENGQMSLSSANVYADRQHYLIEFQDDEVAYITHVKSNTPIGYTSNAKMAAIASPWNVFHDGEEILFYATINNATYPLWVGLTDGYGLNEYTGLIAAEPKSTYMRLLSTLQPAQLISYTCHPEVQAIEAVDAEAPQQQTLMRFGNYELIIHNGQKELKVW